MSMAEVGIVVKNGLWILGLALLLATWSYARYAAYEAQVRTRDKLNELRYSLVLDVGLLLFVVGMAVTEMRIWARVLWVLIGVAVIFHSYLQVRMSRKPDNAAPDKAP